MAYPTVEILAFDTDMGWFGLARGWRGFCGGVLFHSNRDEDHGDAAAEEWPRCVFADEQDMQDVVLRVRDFTCGHRVSFDDMQLDWGQCTPFKSCVYEMVRTVTWGETISYGDVARAVDRPFAARAVGQAMSKNPLPLFVPCHRVIAADGSIGGFGGGSGVALKRKMLALEGCYPRGRLRHVVERGNAIRVPLFIHIAAYSTADFSFDNLIRCLRSAVHAVEPQIIGTGQHVDSITFLEFSLQQCQCQRILQIALNGPLERAGAVVGIVATVRQEIARSAAVSARVRFRAARSASKCSV